jgi:hypothetical protein
MVSSDSPSAQPSHPRGRRMSRTGATAVGALLGLTWAAGFREYMAELAGRRSDVTWSGTCIGVLQPATALGGLLGWAEHRRRAGVDLPHRALVAAAPVAIGVVPLTKPGAIATLAENGQGSAAMAVALAGIGGGYAIAGRGPTWTRILTGVLSAAVVAGVAASVPSIGGPRLALTRPRGALTAVLGAGSAATLALAASVPFRGRGPEMVPRSGRSAVLS